MACVALVVASESVRNRGGEGSSDVWTVPMRNDRTRFAAITTSHVTPAMTMSAKIAHVLHPIELDRFSSSPSSSCSSAITQELTIHRDGSSTFVAAQH